MLLRFSVTTPARDSMRYRTIRALLAAIAVTMSAACERGSETASRAPADDRLTIAMIAKSSTNPVFLAARTGAETAARELSTETGSQIEVVWLTPPQEDGQIQAQRIQQAVNDGADAVLLAASDAGKVTGAINDAVDRGVEVMMFDSDAPQSKRFAYYGVDDISTGEALRHPGRRHVQPHRNTAGCRRRSRPGQQRLPRGQRLGDGRRLAAVHAVTAHRSGHRADQDRCRRCA